MQRAFAGLTWKGVGLIAVLCLLNAVRRTIQGLLNDPTGQGSYYTLLPWLRDTIAMAAAALVLALVVTLAVVATCNLTPSKPRLRYPMVALAVAASSLVGVIGQVIAEWPLFCRGETFEQCLGGAPISFILQNYVRYGSLCAFFTVVFLYVRAADESVRRADQAARDRARFMQRMEEARLRMLQAQIEPHFLFNTLANVRRLYQTSPDDGATMLDNLMRYLAVALPQMREADSTLGREAALTAAYLEIQRIRMGRRLAFDIDVAQPLRQARIPPLMLLTLAENAIKHGLAPLPEGGHIAITANTDGRELQVRVADSGRGFTQSSGGGTGLANTRARLAAMHGAAARLTLALNTPRGVVATIAVPLSVLAGSPG